MQYDQNGTFKRVMETLSAFYFIYTTRTRWQRTYQKSQRDVLNGILCVLRTGHPVKIFRRDTSFLCVHCRGCGNCTEHRENHFKSLNPSISFLGKTVYKRHCPTNFKFQWKVNLAGIQVCLNLKREKQDRGVEIHRAQKIRLKLFLTKGPFYPGCRHANMLRASSGKNDIRKRPDSVRSLTTKHCRSPYKSIHIRD